MVECDCDCEYELYFGITESSNGTFGNRWVIVLLDPKNELCDWYQSVHDKTGKIAIIVPDLPLEFNDRFGDTVRIGTVLKKQLAVFKKVFYDTEPGENHLFAAQFIHNLALQGLVEDFIAWDMLRAANNPGYIWQHLYFRPRPSWEFLADREESCIFETACRNSYVPR